jgi:hypothetical protein
MPPMIDRSMPGVRKPLAAFATFVLLCGAGSARAQAPDQEAAPVPAEAPAAAPAPEAAPGSQVAPPPSAPTPGPAHVASEPAPAPLAAAAASENAEPSWFSRAPLKVGIGEGDQRWSVTIFGFVEADYITDTTRSYNDSIGGTLVARSDTYAGTVGRTQFSMRNTRLGMAFTAPTVGGVRSSALIEGDFFGNQPGSPPGVSESSYYDSPTFRIRHAYLKLQTDVVDIVAGQTYDVFGWQNYFFPCTAEFLGLPNMLFSREPQLRVARTFGADGPVSVDVAVSAVRPGQRDSEVPDADAGLRISLNNWKGITTPGNVGTQALPLSIGVSARARQFKVDAFTPPPTQTSNHIMGWGLSIDALIPIIPAANANDRGNRLTLTGSFVTGTGIADLINTGGGAQFPTLPNPAQANPPPLYSGDVDNGLVTFDLQGVLHTINWQAYRAGLQYYLPGSGRFIVSVNGTYSHSNNLSKLYPAGGEEIELLGSVADTSLYGDANLFWDATPSIRFGLSGQYTRVHYLSQPTLAAEEPHNIRGMGQAVYVF